MGLSGVPSCTTVGYVRDNVGAASDGLLASLALPDADRGTLDGVLGAERAGVLGVLGDFGLLDLLAVWLLDKTVSVEGGSGRARGPCRRKSSVAVNQHFVGLRPESAHEC